MSGLPVLAVAAAALCAMARLAEAGCPIALDGDAEVVDRVRAELGSFGDDGPSCVALWVRCRQNGAELEIDLHDELGRSSLHLFASADGAAAFLVSWSRRPLLDLEAPTPPGLVAPRRPPTPNPAAAPDAQDPSWHPEIGLDYIIASSQYTANWGALDLAMMNRTGPWRYGGDLRAITGGHVGTHFAIEPEIAFGIQLAARQLTATGEIALGDIFTPRGNLDDFSTNYSDAGPRAGLRSTVVWQATAPVGVVLQWGYELLAKTGGGVLGMDHIGLGLRWLP